MAARDERDGFGRYVAAAPGRTPPGTAGAKQRRRTTAFKHFKVDALLSAEERVEYDALIADPNSTIRSLRAWLLARGHNVGTNAVAKHRLSRHVELRLIREATAQAAAYAAMSRRNGPGALAEASHAKFELMLMQGLFGHPEAPAMRPADWQTLSRAVGNVVDNRRNVEALRGEIAKAEADAAAGRATEPRRPATGADVVRRMNLILGMRDPDPNDPLDAEWLARCEQDKRGRG